MLGMEVQGDLDRMEVLAGQRDWMLDMEVQEDS